jgi:hypothetical protein
LLPSVNKITIGPALFNANTALKLLYDRIRCVGMTFHFNPAAAMTASGTCCMFIDYRDDTTVDSLAKAVRTQGAVEFSPWKKCLVVWRPQGPLDETYIASTSSGAFNSALTATFQVYGEGLPTSGLVGYIHASAVLEYTGRQTA